MTIQWTEDLTTGISEIDGQHKELFHRINLIFEACNQGTGRLEVGKTISFLEEYVATHFQTEERIMLKNDYPGYAAHKAQHAVFTEDIFSISRRLDADGPGIPLILQTNRLVVTWLTDHIRTHDRAFGEYLKNWV